MKKIVLFLAEGFEEIEAVSIVDILRRAQLSLQIVSINNELKVTGAHGISLMADDVISKVDFSQVEMLVLPGGLPGADNLNASEQLRELVFSFAKEDRKVAAICAAPYILGELEVLRGCEATVYPGFEESLIGAKVKPDGVVVDRNIITGKGPGYAFDFALALVKIMAGEEVAKEIEAGMLLNE